MSNLQSIVRGKVQADLQRRIDALPGTIQAIQRELAARGLVKSGVMLKRVTSACVESMQDYGIVLTAEYNWAITHSLVASKSWINDLTVEANDSFNPLIEASLYHIRKAVEMVGGTENGTDLTNRLIDELKKAHSFIQNDIRLALQTTLAEKSNGALQTSISTVVNFFTKLISGNGPAR
jgi:hypothetical protein